MALVREMHEETGLEVSEIGDFLGSFHYTSGSGKKSRQFNFVVSVAATEPVTLTEHDEHAWAPVESDLPVTDAVKQVFEAYRQAKQEPVDV
jgi:8-oxo-dGTP diphosphatase